MVVQDAAQAEEQTCDSIQNSRRCTNCETMKKKLEELHSRFSLHQEETANRFNTLSNQMTTISDTLKGKLHGAQCMLCQCNFSYFDTIPQFTNYVTNISLECLFHWIYFIVIQILLSAGHITLQMATLLIKLKLSIFCRKSGGHYDGN